MTTSPTSAAVPRSEVDYPELRMLIAGVWRTTEESIPVHDPATGERIGDCPVVTTELLDDAVRAAARAQAEWQEWGPQRRSDVIREAARILRGRREHIARVMTLEQGKPLANARAEVDRAVEILEWDAEEGRRLYGRVIENRAGIRRIVRRFPLGVIAGFTPWNAPVGSPARKLSGPLAAGCGVVVKAAEETPASAMLLVTAFEEAGVPRGLVNVVFGAPSRTAEFLIGHPLVRGVAFTGSVQVGKQLLEQCGREMKPAVMELGGHAPVIIAEDADVTLAARGALTAKSNNAGQICTSPTRFLVHRSVLDDFVAGLETEARTYRMGPGFDPANNIGPMATERRRRSVVALIEEAVRLGAERRVLVDAPGGPGYFVPLTALVGVPHQARIMSEEPFGPVLIVNPVDSLDEAIEIANGLQYGLAAYAFSRSDRTLEMISDRIECGNLGLNTYLASTADSPLGGVKDSGIGREGGTEGLLNYTYVKNIVKSY